MTALDFSDAGAKNGAMHNQISRPQFGANMTILSIFL